MFRLPAFLKDSEAREMESASRIPKSLQVLKFLPSVRPSYLSLILVFVCGMNLLRIETTNDRLFALEKQMKMLSSSESCVKTGSTGDCEGKSYKTISDSDILVKTRNEKDVANPSGKNNLTVNNFDSGGRGYFGQVLIGMCRHCHLRIPTPLS